MKTFYADNSTFSDPIFKNLNADQVKSMWEMLVSKGTDLRIEFSQIHANENEGEAHWDAYYTFSATGKQVINRINAKFRFKDGKIVKHVDQFNFYLWAAQALGLKGFLFGWAGFLKNRIRKQAMKNLEKFMTNKK